MLHASYDEVMFCHDRTKKSLQEFKSAGKACLARLVFVAFSSAMNVPFFCVLSLMITLYPGVTRRKIAFQYEGDCALPRIRTKASE